MDTSLSPTAGTIPQPWVSPPSSNGSHHPGPVSRRQASVPHSRSDRPLRPALSVGLAILLVLGSFGGLWMLNTPQSESRLMLASDAPTPSDTSTHPIVGAWESADGIPCWCISIFTADGLAIGLDPTHENSTSGMSSQSIAMGFWEPTGDRTAIGIVRIPMDNGGYIERSITWTVSEDGLSATGRGTQRAINEDGEIFTMGGSPPLNSVRMTMAEKNPVATPTD